jgi:ATP-binding cassette subfamily B protein
VAGSTDVVLFRRLLAQARPCWPHAGALLLLGLLSSPLSLLAPLPLKIAVDSVIGSHPLPPVVAPLVPEAMAGSPAGRLALAAGLLLAVALLGQLQGLGSTLLGAWVKEKLLLDFRARLFRHGQRVSLGYHDARGTADSTYRIQHDAQAIHYVLTEGVIPFVSAAVTLAGMVYVMARLDWPLALIALAISPGLVMTARTFRRRLRRQSREVKKLESAALAIVQEVLGALRIVKAFGQEAREEQRFAGRAREGMRARMRLAGFESSYHVLVGLITAAGTAAVLLIGVGHVRAGVLTLGELLMVMSYLSQLYAPLRTVSRKAASLQLHLASAERALALLDEPPDVDERPDARPLRRARGAIAFRNVSFTYGRDRPVLHDISFAIEPGTRLGIAGASGAGKSTLIGLLTRLYDPTEGQIRLDGVDLREFRVQDLRRQFAVVPQDPLLFSASIAANIAYAKPTATTDELVAAAQAANAHEFIGRLPQGYDTQVGERGVQLSGGQRQRIALARAFLTDSPVLVLDEPTSAVDAEAEAAIVEASQRLMRGRTVILITHRSSLLDGCTALLVLENGRAVASTASPPAAGPAPAVPAPAADRHSRTMRHPAVAAWSRLHPGGPMPERITALRPKNPGQGQKTKVYRLEGAGPAGSAVVAKRRRNLDADMERAVYEDILPSLTVPSLRYYGSVEDSEAGYRWLFLEEAIGAEYSNFLAEHRALAARWLGLLHTQAASTAGKARLPDGGPGRYAGCARSAHEVIGQHLDNPVLSADDAAFLESVLACLGELETHWSWLAEACHGVPPTLVHGDFNGKNLRLRSTNAGVAIEVFDWEDAGWGVPAVDLAQVVVPASRVSANPDLAAYWSVVRDAWPDRSLEDLRRLAYCGTVFRALAALYWDSKNLAYDWAPSFIRSMRLYEAELAHALVQLGWSRVTAASRRATPLAAPGRRAH